MAAGVMKFGIWTGEVIWLRVNSGHDAYSENWGLLCIGICQRHRHGGTLFRAHIIQTAAAMIYLRATRKRQMSSDCRTDGRTDEWTDKRQK